MCQQLIDKSHYDTHVARPVKPIVCGLRPARRALWPKKPSWSWRPPMATTETSNAAVAETAIPRAGSRPRVQSVARAISILVAVAESPNGLKAMEIAARLGLGRQGTYHLLHTLVGCGMLARNQQNRYVPGLQVAILSDAFVRHLAPPEHLAPLVRQVAAETRETAYAVGWRDGEIVNLVSAPGSNAIQAMTVPQGYHPVRARARRENSCWPLPRRRSASATSQCTVSRSERRTPCPIAARWKPSWPGSGMTDLQRTGRNSRLGFAASRSRSAAAARLS